MEKLIYTIGRQTNLPVGGLGQLGSELEKLCSVNVSLDKEAKRKLEGVESTERRIEVHPTNHIGVMPCRFDYTVELYANKDGISFWIARVEYNSENLGNGKH